MPQAEFVSSFPENTYYGICGMCTHTIVHFVLFFPTNTKFLEFCLRIKEAIFPWPFFNQLYELLQRNDTTLVIYGLL